MTARDLPPLKSEVLGHDADDTIDAEQLINGGTRIRRVASEDGFTTSYHIQPATHEAYVQEREARTRYNRVVDWLRQQFWDGTLVAHFIQKGMKPVQSTQWSSASFFGTAVGRGVHAEQGKGPLFVTHDELIAVLPTDAEIDTTQGVSRVAEHDTLDNTGTQKLQPDQTPYPDAKQFKKVRPHKLLPEWLDPAGRSNKYDYRRMSMMLDIWKDNPGQEYLFVRIGSKAKIVKRLKEHCALKSILVPGDSQLRDFVTAWLFANAPDWYWKAE